ncbi:AMP-binding protein [Mycolicibacterium llatzerense]|uniref:AMP-binding protein n=1 Tax=Mycolicibacterium llatzerense TaxID=280871 RepID=UPI0027E19729|nr:AMP-binding protein [Mycolicibacterium llatzerense]MCT7364522.1 acyl-CoA synthetase [Mycolicibacterium llatzerense]
MSVIESSLPAVLRERASLQPNDVAFTFMDYDTDPDGVAKTLTWAQLYQQSVAVAHELRQHGEIGDRVVIVAPQCLEYVVGFLGALEAGMIAVPLTQPIMGHHDERVISVMKDAQPVVALTTAASKDAVAQYATPNDDGRSPAVLAVDELDLETRRKPFSRREVRPETAYLQYTSGSTRTAAGVMVSHRNVSANYEQMIAVFFSDWGKVAPAGSTVVTWLPLYHDMGLLLGVCTPILGGWHTVMTSPISFLVKPARWVQLMGSHKNVITAAPNFAFDLAAARTTDEDMAGKDMSSVLTVFSGAERVQPTTIKRYIQRFAKFGLPGKAIRPSYGLAEATLYVASRESGEPPTVVDFDTEKLADGIVERVESGSPLVSYGFSPSPLVRIVDPETRREAAEGTVGEIWTHGENVCAGYWNKPEETEKTFRGVLEDAPEGTPSDTWLRTGDLGFISEGSLFIIGRIKDLLIIRGRNLYPDDIEATVSAVSGGRTAAVGFEEDGVEQFAVVIEMKKRGDTEDEVRENLAQVKHDITSAISQVHGVNAADLVLVGRGSIPITTSGKIRRQACTELYRKGELARLDA